MNRIPASLLYLTVYNPTIKPTGSIPDGDEDAEEQAQILFYTARDRAVSRDRILRQIGLAKALVNFTEMFNPGGEPCENVHSQTRRMVMISPEPGFWLHACVELPKTARQPAKSPGKGKKSEPVKQDPLFDHHEGLVHDIALKAHLQRGYELFKIRHGSFTSIFETLGQQALELQLERFFTVWAWSWDMEEQPDFSLHLGRSLHPYYNVLASQFEPLDDVLPVWSIPFALSPSGLIPSPRFTEFSPSPALVQHLRSIIPEYIPSVPHPSPDPELDTTVVKPATSSENVPGQRQAGSGFAMPTIPIPAVNLNMDVRSLKWSWPGYLTFGKNTKDKNKQKNVGAATDEQKTDSELEAKSDVEGEGEMPSMPPAADNSVDPTNVEEKVGVKIEVDAVSLADAMESENSYGGSSNEHSPGISTPDEAAPSPATRTIVPGLEDDATPAVDLPTDLVPVTSEGEKETTRQDPSTRPPSPSPEEPLPSISEPQLPPVTFSQTVVHLAPSGYPLQTTKRRLYYLTKEDITVAIVDDESSSLQLQENLQPMAEVVLKVAENLRSVIDDEEQRGMSGTPVTAAKILQPKDTHIFSVEGDYAVTGVGGFKSTSEHLFKGQQLLESDQDIIEVFTRDSNPQHWHVSRRGNKLVSDGRNTPSTIYYHSARKESSLADVDDEVATALRKFMKSRVKSVSRANTIVASPPEAHT